MKRERMMKQPELESMLGTLALGSRTRISVARILGTDDYIDAGEMRRIVELGGFVVHGPIKVDDLLRRYGPGAYRVTAYGFDPTGVLWEVYASIAST